MKKLVEKELSKLMGKYSPYNKSKNIKDVDWDYVYWKTTYNNLSEDFMREFVDKVEWFYISHHKKLSEDFIRKFQNKVDWDSISWYQELSENFIREFKEKLCLKEMLKEEIISQKFYNELKYGKPLTRYEILDFS